MEALAARDARVPEVLVLVLERDVVIEPERSQVGEVLHLVRGVDARRDQRQRDDEGGGQHRELPPHAQLAQAEPEADHLDQVERGVADHRRDDAAARQVDDAPEHAEQRRDDHHAPALDVVAEAEQEAEAEHPDQRAAEALLEAVQDERALDLLAHAAGEDGDERQQHELHARRGQRRERVGREEARRPAHQRHPGDHGQQEHPRHAGRSRAAPRRPIGRVPSSTRRGDSPPTTSRASTRPTRISVSRPARKARSWRVSCPSRARRAGRTAPGRRRPGAASERRSRGTPPAALAARAAPDSCRGIYQHFRASAWTRSAVGIFRVVVPICM